MWQIAGAHFCVFFWANVWHVFWIGSKSWKNTLKKCRSFMNNKTLLSGDHAGSLLLTWKMPIQLC